jgi:hypothetical protein
VFGSAVIGGGDGPERVPASIATANFFSTLGVQPILGRAFRPDKEKGAHDIVIISHGLWQQRFGRAQACSAGMLLVAFGIALGLAGSFAAIRFVSGMRSPSPAPTRTCSSP